jgi:hypothetical protein
VGEKLRDHMPPLYGGLLPSLFDRPTLDETRATCSDCAMCDKRDTNGDAPSPGDRELDTAFFRPDIKCCSYHPTLPNYLVGAILSDASPDLDAGRERIREKIARRVGVTPDWLAAPRKYLVLLDAARETSFGRSEALLCPYFEREGGRCTIWRHRESVCATFFCKHVAGARGHAFWTALRRYLYHVERTLARHARDSVSSQVVEPDLPKNRLTREDLEDRPPRDAEYARAWGDWVGREEAFYVACANQVRALDEAAFEGLVGGGQGADLLRAVASAHEGATELKLAPRLVLNPDMGVAPASEGVGVTTYSRYDSLFLSEALHDALKHFSGEETVDVVLEKLQKEHDVELPRAVLLELQLHDVMTPPK